MPGAGLHGHADPVRRDVVVNVTTDAILLEMGKLHMGLVLAQVENARLTAELAKAKAALAKLTNPAPSVPDGEEVCHGR